MIGNSTVNLKFLTELFWKLLDIICLNTPCQDLVPSKRFPNNPWSYEACATPSIGSVLCPTAVVPAVVPAAPVAPVAPVHPTYPAAPTDLHPVAPHHPEVVVGAGPAGPGLGGVLTGNYDPESIGDIRLGDASSKSEYLDILFLFFLLF